MEIFHVKHTLLVSFVVWNMEPLATEWKFERITKMEIGFRPSSKKGTRYISLIIIISDTFARGILWYGKKNKHGWLMDTKMNEDGEDDSDQWMIQNRKGIYTIHIFIGYFRSENEYFGRYDSHDAIFHTHV